MRVPCAVTVLDPRMVGVLSDSNFAVPFSDGRWLEGPAYSAQGRYLLFSDIPNDRTLRLDEMSGKVAVFDSPSRFANGRTFDRNGRAVTCLHGDRAVVRREHDGTETLIAAEYAGRRLNSPNDVVVDSRGDIWFTDPTYGIVSDYEGHAAEPEQPVRGLYRWHDADGTLELVTGDFDQPNGLAFTPDESSLYVVDSGRGSITELPLTGDRVPRVVVAGDYRFDGIRVDPEGRIWAATVRGVSCFDADGVEMLQIAVPERVSNLTFGGRQGNVLYLTATTSLYAVRTSITGR
ncbi:MAG: SMP-30/gluconolactonase/LRE family protein [Pseudolysinimonas sp.]|uniref:SMP-30/gluconolactonase/LRE family protein n=1 Tax=Pseudolysinimonas sp. TaxID=2680009 RepID=UPI003266B454